MTSVEPGAAVILKLDEGVTVSGVADNVTRLFTVTSTVPVAAPAGITNAKLLLVKLERGAVMVPPLCLLRVTCGTEPAIGMKLLPVTFINEPAGADFGLKSVIF